MGAPFTVVDFEAAGRHIEDVRVGVADRSGDGFTLNPADCFGAVYGFTGRTVPGDPRALDT
jgi:hypothetical protein